MLHLIAWPLALAAVIAEPKLIFTIIGNVIRSGWQKAKAFFFPNGPDWKRIAIALLALLVLVLALLGYRYFEAEEVNRVWDFRPYDFFQP